MGKRFVVLSVEASKGQADMQKRRRSLITRNEKDSILSFGFYFYAFLNCHILVFFSDPTLCKISQLFGNYTTPFNHFFYVISWAHYLSLNFVWKTFHPWFLQIILLSCYEQPNSQHFIASLCYRYAFTFYRFKFCNKRFLESLKCILSLHFMW